MQSESSETRTCRECGAQKPANAFCASRVGRPWCKQCMAAYERVRRKQFRIDHANDPKPTPMSSRERAVCTRCGLEKAGAEFSTYWAKRRCKACSAALEMARNRRRGMAPLRLADRDDIGRRRCAMCHEFRPIEHFRVVRGDGSRRNGYCKSCTARRVSRWRAANPDRARASVRAALTRYGHLYRHRRRAQKFGVGWTEFTANDWRIVVDMFAGRCAYCWRRTTLTQDHVMALSRGGTHSLDNIVPACRSCNSQKNAKTLLEFLLTRSLRSS